MDYGVDESVDFDFFDKVPVSPSKDQQDRSPRASTSKPPVRPRSAKQAFTDNGVNGKDSAINDKSRKHRSPSESSSNRDSSPDYSSDYASDSEDKKSQDRGRVKGRHSSSSVSSRSSTDSRSPSTSGSDRSRSRSHSNTYSHSPQGSKVNKSRSSSGSDRPGNPIAKGERSVLPKRGRSRQGEDEYSSSAYSDGDDTATKKSSSVCPDDGDHARDRNVRNRGKQEAWGEGNRQKAKSAEYRDRDRPKTAKHRASHNSYRNRRGRSRSKSDSLSDSDITDVSPMDSPRNGAQGRMTAAGDGGSVKAQFKAMPVTDLDLRDNDDDHDPDRTSGLDLEILMKAVGELEKQKRLQANSRRVMFAPMTLKRSEKSNYTFDDNQTRDIERENQRLLNEIVRRVSSKDQKKQFHRPPGSYKLTPSAVNREREIKRIESENLAFLKRLQKVKPTKTISRENQLRAYESTTLHGVPIAALHPMTRSGRHSVMGDMASSIGSRTRSMTSINSATSSVRSMGSRQSSRPSSATKRPGSATKRIDRRPEWSDRW